MRLQEVVEQVRYVTTAGGQPTSVQVGIDVWTEIVTLLQQFMSADDGEEGRVSFPTYPHRAAMQREIAAYEAMHSTLVPQFLGYYVAIHQGHLVDHDLDPVSSTYGLWLGRSTR